MQRWAKIVIQVFDGNFNWAAIVISVLCITFLVLVRLVNKKLWKLPWYKKLPIPIPSQLIAVSTEVCFVFCTYVVELSSKCQTISKLSEARFLKHKDRMAWSLTDLENV